MTETIVLLTPEIVLAAVAILICMAGAFFNTKTPWSWIALAGVLGAALAMAIVGDHGVSSSTLEVDALARYARWLALGVGGLLVLLTSRPLSTSGTSEYTGSLLLAIAGTMLVSSAGNLILLFVGLELISIPTYVLLFLGRHDTPSREAAAKYFFLSILASAILLYGFSFLYGVTGSMDLRALRQISAAQAAKAAALGPLANIALVLIVAGLGFRITAVPFHFYAPDVYQGTTHGNAGLLSIVPKIAGFVVLLRLLDALVTLPDLRQHAWQIVLGLSIVTMTLGNVLALWQHNIRRLMAYSSIAHAGYLLIALAVFLAPGPGTTGPWNGTGALLFYLIVYAVATVGTFAALAALGDGDAQLDGIDELAGLGWTGGFLRPMLAWCLVVFMFSLAGIPPLAGFWGKLAVFASALVAGGRHDAAQPWFIALAIIGVLNAAVAAAYYLRIVGVMFFRLPLATPAIRRDARPARFAAVLCALLVLGIGLGPGPWLRNAQRATTVHPATAPVASRPAPSSPASTVLCKSLGSDTSLPQPQREIPCRAHVPILPD